MHIGILVFLRWRYLINSPVSTSMTVPNYSHHNFNGNFLDASLLRVSGAAAVSIHANMNSCVNVIVVRPSDRVLLAGGFYSSWAI